MKKTFSSKKSAFSLIELSIVLIVIGLLIAGVTGGASLIKSSELRSVMSEARGYAVAVNAFYSQYDALPGDYGSAIDGSETSYYGDADGNIEFAGDASVLGFSTTYGSEGSVAWHVLSHIGAIDDTITASAAENAQTVGTNIPSSKIKSAGWILGYTDSTTTMNAAVLTRATEAATDNQNTEDVATAALLTADAKSIDTKLDDGIPTTGRILGLDGQASGDGTCVASAAYSIAVTTRACALAYKVDVTD